MDNKTTANNEELQIDLLELLLAFLHRWWLFAILGIIVAGGVFLYTYIAVTPMYRASVSLFVNNRQARDDTGYVSSADITTSRNLVPTYITIAKSDTVLEDVANRLEGRYSVAKLKSMISISQVSNTEVFSISAVSPDPVEAARVANAMAEVAPGAIASIIEGSSAKVVDYAKVPSSRYTPSYTKNTLIGLLIGLVIAGLIVTIQTLTDVRIKDEEDINKVCSYPIIGQIPNFDLLGSGKKGKSYAYAKAYASGAKQHQANGEGTT